MTKVLVFESDQAFAGELRHELGKLGCTVHVVDDGNVGLAMAAQDQPDLILLAIELPRMNGFSVCNKLKKDPQLKDVPLIIMSSGSPEDTFEQHRKLRTRAEDYVHKPVAFGELMQRIRALVPIGGADDAGDLDDDIVIDDAFEVVEPEPADERTVQLFGSASRSSALPPAPSPRVDAEVDDFIGGAFERLLGEEADESTQVRNMSEIHSAIRPAPRPPTVQPPPLTSSPRTPPPPRANSTPPPSSAEVELDAPPAAQFRVADHSSVPPVADSMELERLRAELERAKVEVVHLTKELGGAHATARRLEGELASTVAATGEAERLRREVDDLKQRLGAGGSKAGISSREFLDLRETLNRKDKELLAMRDQVSHKEKDILDLRDQLLSFERERADSTDRLIEAERAAAELEDKVTALQTDRDLAAKRGDEAKAHGDALEQQLAALAAEAEAARGRASAELAQFKAEHHAAIEAAAAAHRAAVSAVEAGAAEKLAAQEAALLAQHARAAELAEARHAEALAQARAQADQRVADAEAAHQSALAEALAEADRRFAVAEAAHGTALVSVQESADRALAEAVAAHDAASQTWAGAKRELDGEIFAHKRSLDEAQERLAAAEGRNGELEALLARRAAELASTTTELSAQSVALEQQRERAETAEELGREQAAEITQLVEARDGLRAERERLAAELGREKVLLEKARRKWGEDRVSLERAREALALALGKIEEAEGRSIE